MELVTLMDHYLKVDPERNSEEQHQTSVEMVRKMNDIVIEKGKDLLEKRPFAFVPVMSAILDTENSYVILDSKVFNVLGNSMAVIVNESKYLSDEEKSAFCEYSARAIEGRPKDSLSFISDYYTIAAIS